MKRYVQCHTLYAEATDAVRSFRGSKEPYNGITEVWFDSIEDLGGDDKEAMSAALKLYHDEAEFLDFANSCVFITQEYEIF